jgi:hypothetical protein
MNTDKIFAKGNKKSRLGGGFLNRSVRQSAMPVLRLRLA